MHILIAIIAFLTAYIWLPIVLTAIGVLFITCLNGVFWWKETLGEIYKDSPRPPIQGSSEQAANKEENWNETYDKAEATLNNTSTFLAVSLGIGFIGLVFLAYM